MRVKICNRCLEEKPATLANFVRAKSCVGEIGSYCRPCSKAIQAQWERENRERIRPAKLAQQQARRAPAIAAKNAERARRAPFVASARTLRNSIRDRALERGLPVDHRMKSQKFIADWLEKQPTCVCCGVEFLMGKKGFRSDRSASFDQITPGAGYLMSNIALVCWRCNNIKRNYGSADLRLVADWIDSVRGDKVGKFK